MNYPKSSTYNLDFIRENIMGPNPMKLTEELMQLCPLAPDSTVLDLGCGRGVTSIFLVKEYGLRVFASDLWVSPSENWARFQAMKLDAHKIIPIYAEAHALPFAHEFFDAVVSVDSYHYFGTDPNYLEEHLLPFERHGGYLIIAVPGMRKDLHDHLPPEMLINWTSKDLDTIHDANFWRNTLSATKCIEQLHIAPMQSNEECWQDWLQCDNDYARGDKRAFDAGAGKYMNFIAIILRKN